MPPNSSLPYSESRSSESVVVKKVLKPEFFQRSIPSALSKDQTSSSKTSQGANMKPITPEFFPRAVPHSSNDTSTLQQQKTHQIHTLTVHTMVPQKRKMTVITTEQKLKRPNPVGSLPRNIGAKDLDGLPVQLTWVAKSKPAEETSWPKVLGEGQVSAYGALRILLRQESTRKKCESFPKLKDDTVGCFLVKRDRIPPELKSDDGTVFEAKTGKISHFNEIGRMVPDKVDKDGHLYLRQDVYRKRQGIATKPYRSVFHIRQFSILESGHIRRDWFPYALLCVAPEQPENLAMAENKAKKSNYCNACQKQCKDLKRHMQQVHWRVKPKFYLACQDCDFGISNRGRQVFTHQCTLKKKKQKASGKKKEEAAMHPCSLCNMACHHHCRLLKHFKEMHVGQRLNVCPVCEKAINDFPTMKTHMGESHPEQHLGACPESDCFFQVFLPCESAAMEGHEQEAHKPEPFYTCQTCSKQYKRPHMAKDCYLRHLLAEKRRRESYPCELCDKEFDCNRKLGVHRRKMHIEKGPCPYCGKLFHPDHLEMHIKQMHPDTDFKSFKCNICDAKLATEKRLVVHQRREHQMELELPDEKCPQCGRTFAGKTAKIRLNSHIRVDHEELRKTCEQCGKQMKPGKIFAHRLKHFEEEQAAAGSKN